MTSIQRLNNVLLKIMKKDPGDLSRSTVIMDLPGMSSLAFIRLVVAVEREFSLKFDTRSILEIVTIGDMERLIEANGE